MQYESPITSGKKVMAKVKVFQKWVKLQGQGHKNYGTMFTNTKETSAYLDTPYWTFTGIQIGLKVHNNDDLV